MILGFPGTTGPFGDEGYRGSRGPDGAPGSRGRDGGGVIGGTHDTFLFRPNMTSRGLFEKVESNGEARNDTSHNFEK